AATAEQKSEHPLARLITQAGSQHGLLADAVEEFVAHPGSGVTARTAHARLVVGTQRLLEETGIALTTEARDVLERLDQSGHTGLLVARDGVILGVIGARDRVRPEAAGVLA